MNAIFITYVRECVIFVWRYPWIWTMWENKWNNSKHNIENNNINVYFFFVFNKKYDIITQFIRLNNTEYGCAIPFLFAFSQVLNGNIYSI